MILYQKRDMLSKRIRGKARVFCSRGNNSFFNFCIDPGGFLRKDAGEALLGCKERLSRNRVSKKDFRHPVNASLLKQSCI